MVKMLKENHSRFIRFLSDALLLSACCLFLISVVEPFMTSNLILPRWHQLPVEARVSVTYWSYKAIINLNNLYYHEQLLFNDYWFSQNEGVPIVFMGIPMFLITMFLTQVFTLVLGLLSLFFKKKKLRIIPFVSSAIVTVLTVRTYVETSASHISSVKYEPGYWLAYPSMLFFIIAFILSTKVRR
jgi:hypothetical protein